MNNISRSRLAGMMVQIGRYPRRRGMRRGKGRWEKEGMVSAGTQAAVIMRRNHGRRPLAAVGIRGRERYIDR